MTFVDVGCGYGFFAIPAANMVGREGRVIGVDVDQEWLECLRRDSEKEGIGNVETIFGMGEETVVRRGCADMVFFGMVLHDFEDPLKVLANARLMLKPNAVLVDLDWKKEDGEVGPPVAIRLSKEEASAMISQQGFAVFSLSDQGRFHYLILASPSDPQRPWRSRERA